MLNTDLVVIAAATAAIIWINWYFFLSQRQAATASAGAGGLQEVNVIVKGGYEPATIRARAGVPLRIVFDRRETSSCSEEVVFPDFGVKRFLPAFEKTTIELTPAQPGAYGFTCGMNMLHGKLIVDEASEAGHE